MASKGMESQPKLTLHPLSSYTFGQKEAIPDKDATVLHHLERMRAKYATDGLRRTVEAVMVVHEHNHPHVLLLQSGSSTFRLPGGRLRPGEEEAEGLRRKLERHLGPEAESARSPWEVSELLATWYRPGFENSMYPYCPAHAARPKEIRHVYLVPLPERRYFGVPKNRRLVAVPLFELFDNAARYGALVSSCPEMLSRFSFSLAAIDGGVRPVPGGGPPVLQGRRHGPDAPPAPAFGGDARSAAAAARGPGSAADAVADALAPVGRPPAGRPGLSSDPAGGAEQSRPASIPSPVLGAAEPELAGGGDEGGLAFDFEDE